MEEVVDAVHPEAVVDSVEAVEAADAEALNTIKRCAKLATNDSEGEEEELGFRLVLTFDLAVTPSEAFAKFWENDYFLTLLLVNVDFV